MRDLNTLGAKPLYNRPFSPFSDSEIRDFEIAFAVNLPLEYVELLRFANGGVLDMCEYRDSVTGGIGGINDFYGLGSREQDEKAAMSGKWDGGNLWGETRIFRTLLFKGSGVPFARDGGDNQLFFDFRNSQSCISRFIFATQLSYQIAPSFDKFLDMLHARTEVKGKRPRRT